MSQGMRETSAVQLSGGSRASRQPMGAQAQAKGFWSSARVLERLELRPASPAPPSPEPEDQPAAKRRAYEPFEQALQDDLQRYNLQPAPHMVGGLRRAAYLGQGAAYQAALTLPQQAKPAPLRRGLRPHVPPASLPPLPAGGASGGAAGRGRRHLPGYPSHDGSDAGSAHC